MAEYIYDAFISYSHRDMKWARWLQRKLEASHIPASLTEADAESRDESAREELPPEVLLTDDAPDAAEQAAARSRKSAPSLPRGRQRLHIFRDQTDLAGTDLRTTLQKELGASRCLIVICSPAGAVSDWVDGEVRYFQSIGRTDSIIPFIVEGEPESSDPELECYPPALREQKDRHALGANVQEIGRNKAFLKLLSILLGVRFNRLVDRDKARRRRTILTTSALATVTALIFLGLFLHNRSISRENQELSYDVYGAALLSITEKDKFTPEDVALLQVSAKSGNVDAIFYLAYCYLTGNGIDQDLEKAFELYKQGAEAGNPYCMVGLATRYSQGEGTEPDQAKAFTWYKAAAEAGDKDGMYYLAIFYEDGIGTEADEEAALYWYEKAAEAGYELGIYNLARCYRDGIGTEENREMAFYWISKLAEAGNPEGMYNLGLCYQDGFGTEEDPAKAAYWYRKAADAGDADGAYKMGWCVENGYGITDPALEWYEHAAELGSEEAGEAIKRLEAGSG